MRHRFYTSIPHQKVTTDTSEFKYYKRDKNKQLVIKKLYLDLFLDMFNGEILSYRISDRPNAKAIIDAQKEAMDRMIAPIVVRSTLTKDGLTKKAYKKQLTK